MPITQRRRLAWLKCRSQILVAVAVAQVVGCAAVERIPDKPRPAAKLEAVNFGTLFNQVVHSSSAYPTVPVDRALMQRLLVGPNIVFEASRSSLAETVVVGPPDSHPAAPDLNHALGLPIAARLSGMLLRFLMAKGVVALAPAVMRRWCVDQCDPSTWVERLLLLHRVGPKGLELGRVGDPAMLPTGALAVRRLEAGMGKLDVYLVRPRERQTVEAKLRPGEGEAILCYWPEMAVPTVWFQAEMVSLRDGRILARMDERRTAVTNSPLEVEVVSVDWKAVRRREAAGMTAYHYISAWDPELLLCATARRELEGLIARTPDLKDPSGQVPRLISSLLGRLLVPEAPTAK